MERIAMKIVEIRRLLVSQYLLVREYTDEGLVRQRPGFGVEIDERPLKHFPPHEPMKFTWKVCEDGSVTH